MKDSDFYQLQEAFQEVLEFAQVSNKISLETAREIAGEIGTKLGFRVIMPEQLKPNTTFIPRSMILTGSIRREKPEIGDIDLVCTGDIDEHDIQQIQGVNKVWARGEKQLFFDYTSDKGIDRPINIFVLDRPGSFGAFMMHTTGSNIFNIVLRKSAKKNNRLINQYGVFVRTTNQQLAGRSEAEMFNALNKPYVFPKDRV